jgi:hypothetical protein
MQFNEGQQREVNDLMTRGFSQSLAEMTVAAKAAGYSKATDVGAGIVRILTGQEKGTKPDIAAQKKRLQESLDKLAGKSDPASIQQSISIKRQLSELNRL